MVIGSDAASFPSSSKMTSETATAFGAANAKLTPGAAESATDGPSGYGRPGWMSYTD